MVTVENKVCMKIRVWASFAMSVFVFVGSVLFPVFVNIKQDTWVILIFCGFFVGLGNIILYNLSNPKVLPMLSGLYVCVLVFVISSVNGYSENRIVDGAIVGAVAGGFFGLLVKAIAKSIFLPRQGQGEGKSS